MNRAHRRKNGKLKENPKNQQSGVFSFPYVGFSEIPLENLCQSIVFLINELRSRGYPVYDFDNKDKSVQGLKIIKNKVYFLAAREAAKTNGEEKPQ